MVPGRGLDGDPAQVREFADRCFSSEPSVATGFDPAKGHLRLIMHGGTIDVADAGFDALGDFKSTGNIAAEHSRRQTVLAVVRQPDGFVHGMEAGYGNARPKGFFPKNLHL